MVVPSHFIPLAALGVITQGLKWMLNKRSPFYLRPRLDPELWSWCWHFMRHSNQKHVDNSKELLRDISLESRQLMVELSEELEFPLVKRGLFMLCQLEAGLHEESEVAAMARESGIEAEVCTPERLSELDPDVEMNAIGGVWFPQDCHLESEVFLAELRSGIKKHGGDFREGEVSDFRFDKNQVTHAITTAGEEIAADGFTIAGRTWSSVLANRLELRLPMQGGKGYSFTLPKPSQLPQLCSLLKEGRVVVTPIGENLRVAGTMEICGNDLSIDRSRLAGIIETFCRFFTQYQIDDLANLEPRSGLRPCSPDGIPYIGVAPGYSNITIATGHSMLGLSLAPVTGRLITSIVGGGEVDFRFAPQRF